MSKSDNAFKHGAYAQLTVMPWEDQADFNDLHEELVLELQPFGVLEQSIVLEIADLQWRKRRLHVAQLLAAYKDAPPPELMQAAKRGAHGIAEYISSQKPRGGGLLMTATQAIDLVKKKITGDELPTPPAQALPPTAIERAYDPDSMMRFLRAEASLDGRITKLLQRLAGLKAFEKLHGLDCDLEADCGSGRCFSRLRKAGRFCPQLLA
jgi:hypothetical protein